MKHYIVFERNGRRDAYHFIGNLDDITASMRSQGYTVVGSIPFVHFPD